MTATPVPEASSPLTSLVAVVLFVVLLPLPIRCEKARKAAVNDYTSACERVVSAALTSKSHPHGDPSPS